MRAKSTTTTMEHEGGSGLRTRSKAAPDWNVEESLILVNEITAIEADCGGTLSSFQKWKIIVENCNALGVNRNLNQCRRKWDSLLSDYKKIKQSGSKKASFNSELFKAIERYILECEDGYDTDPDAEESPEPPLAASLQSEYRNDKQTLKNQRTNIVTPQKQTVEEKGKPMRCVAVESIEAEEYSSDHHKSTESIDGEEHEQNMAENLRENAELIEAIVNRQMDADLFHGDNSRIDVDRMKADQIIICLSNLAVTLDELRKLHTDSTV